MNLNRIINIARYGENSIKEDSRAFRKNRVFKNKDARRAIVRHTKKMFRAFDARFNALAEG